MLNLSDRVHVRRTDKVGSEAAFHSIDEYMSHVADFFKQLEMSQVVDKRRIYLASDDPGVFHEITSKLVHRLRIRGVFARPFPQETPALGLEKS